MPVVTRALPIDGVSDATVIEQSRREPERFAAIFDRYYHQIYGFAAERLGQSLAEDVAAETFAIAFDRRDRYDVSRSDARPWLYGITANLIAGRPLQHDARRAEPGECGGPADDHAPPGRGRGVHERRAGVPGVL